MSTVGWVALAAIDVVLLGFIVACCWSIRRDRAWLKRHEGGP